MTRPPNDRLLLLRPRTYVVAPREWVLFPMITSTLFPQLPRVYRNPFRIGMAIMLAGVIVLSALGLLGPLVVLAALGVPALFMLYLWQSGVPHDIPGHAFALAAGLGAGFGVGWVWITGGLVARIYGVPMAAGFLLQNLVSTGLVIAIGGAALMILPAVLVRILVGLRRRSRESLDGFTIGALSALSFTAAATTTRLAPQFVAGLLTNVHPVRRFADRRRPRRTDRHAALVRTRSPRGRPPWPGPGHPVAVHADGRGHLYGHLADRRDPVAALAPARVAHPDDGCRVDRCPHRCADGVAARAPR
jgi:hypothetical protein